MSDFVMTENEIARVVVDSCYVIHSTLGPGLLESVYEKILLYELRERGCFVEHQARLPVIWKNVFIDNGFRADLVVEKKVILELKSVESIAPVHYKQLLTYLRLSDARLGLLINFGEQFIKDGIRRVVNNL